MDNKAPKAYYVPVSNVTDGGPSPGWYWVEPWSDRIRGPYLTMEFADEAAASEFSRWRRGDIETADHKLESAPEFEAAREREDREFREWCIAAASSAEGSASITARNAWNARAALANIAVGAYLGKMTLRDRDAAMDSSLNDLQTTACAEGRADERAEVLRELLCLRELHQQVKFVLACCVPVTQQQREVWPELERRSKRADG